MQRLILNELKLIKPMEFPTSNWQRGGWAASVFPYSTAAAFPWIGIPYMWLYILYVKENVMEKLSEHHAVLLIL